jgi:hypothetical protein
MAQFNLNDYETVEARIARFYKDHPKARIITQNLTTKQDRQVSTWVVQAIIYLDEGNVPKATGLAFEVDGQGMANKTSALENAETSAIGRALANAGYSGNKRTSREEMQKVETGITPSAARNWKAEIENLTDVDLARQLYNEARTSKAGQIVLKAIEAKVKSFASPTE